MREYKIVESTRFQKELKRAKQRGLPMERLASVVAILARGEQLPPQYRDHPLSGDFLHCRECHIQPDWLLIYRYVEDELILHLLRTGTHSDLF